MTQPTNQDLLGDVLRAAFREGPDAVTTTAPSCLPLERLAEIGSGETPSEVEKSHVKDCARCSAEIALAAAFYEDESTAGAHAEEVGRIVEILEARHSALRSEPAAHSAAHSVAHSADNT
ncbi:MAG: hypothetical protein K8J08_11215, partial [Thermoanaerobaculia bacterium]|nr:hypothetical protein [Thermoanaerobaculia bacterium]